VKTFTKSAISTLFLLCASTAYADPLCIPVDGTVSSTPIPCVDIPEPLRSTLCTPFNPENIVPGMCLPEVINPVTGVTDPVCFRISGKGKAKIEGEHSFSRLTFEVAANQSGGILTPLVFPSQQDPGNPRADLTVFTSSASLTGKVRNLKGTLHTRDTGVITAGGVVGQVLKIVGGSPGSDFEGATGTIAVAGQEVGGAAVYTGEVCLR